MEEEKEQESKEITREYKEIREKGGTEHLEFRGTIDAPAPPPDIETTD